MQILIKMQAAAAIYIIIIIPKYKTQLIYIKS